MFQSRVVFDADVICVALFIVQDSYREAETLSSLKRVSERDFAVAFRAHQEAKQKQAHDKRVRQSAADDFDLERFD